MWLVLLQLNVVIADRLEAVLRESSLSERSKEVVSYFTVGWLIVLAVCITVASVRDVVVTTFASFRSSGDDREVRTDETRGYECDN